MIEAAEFVARENIRRFKAQLLIATEGVRKSTICELLANEERLLRDLVAGRS
jgi:hypothetical protein